ncbi:MAG TPA: DNA polymerase subunit beta, partial [Methanomicrobiales archaeon]|nr:DNA polymerase subunit beta [Methanomicrobiales archaeon]
MRAPIRLRDFIEDRDGWLYAVSTYDNRDRVGCVLRYMPDPAGERIRTSGKRYHKFDFEEAFDWIGAHKPEYLDVILRVPQEDVTRVYRPEEEIGKIAERNWKVRDLVRILDLPPGGLGCTGSLLVGLENEKSDIDLVT